MTVNGTMNGSHSNPPAQDQATLLKRVAELEQHVAALEVELRTYQAIVANSPDGIALATIDGMLLYSNAAHQRMTERGPGNTITDHFLPTDVARIEREIMPFVLEHGQWQGLLTVCNPSGTLWKSETSTFAVHDEQGAPKYFVTTMRDMGEQQAQAQQLRLFEVLVENVPDGVVLTTTDGIITYANAAFRAMSGFGQETVGLCMPDMLASPETLEQRHLVETLDDQSVWQGTKEYRRSDGTTYTVFVSLVLIRDDQGQPYAHAGIIRDTTDQQNAEQERIALQEQVIVAQQQALRELSTPLIPLTDSVVVMPLIGSVDSRRAQQIVDTLLDGVAESRASTAIIDITGVPVVDTQVASALLQAAQAVRLLGANVMLTGIRPEVAQTLVGLGVDMSGITTRSTLQSAIAEAFLRRPSAKIA